MAGDCVATIGTVVSVEPIGPVAAVAWSKVYMQLQQTSKQLSQVVVFVSVQCMTHGCCESLPDRLSASINAGGITAYGGC